MSGGDAGAASLDFIGEVPEWEPRHIPKAPNGRPINFYNNVSNAVSEPPADSFEVRGPNYLVDKKKIPALAPIFSMVDVRPFSHSKPVWHAAATLKPLRDYLASHPDREFFIANRVLPLTNSVHVMAVFVRTQDKSVDPVFERSWSRFKEGDDEYRNLRLKYIAKIPNASWGVKTAVGTLGGFRPVIMGKGYLELKHFSGLNYTEVDIDIGSSRIARGVVGVVIPQAKKMIVDEAFFVEGQQPDELPERMLGLCRCVHYDLEKNTLVVTPDMLTQDPFRPRSGISPSPGVSPIELHDEAKLTAAAKEKDAEAIAAALFSDVDTEATPIDADEGAFVVDADNASDSDDDFQDAIDRDT